MSRLRTHIREMAADLLITRLNAELAEPDGSVRSAFCCHMTGMALAWAVKRTGWLLHPLWKWLRHAIDTSPKRVARNAVEYRREDNWELNDAPGQPGLMQLFRTLLEKCAGEDLERV